jgi:hypothetical protein
LQIVIEGWGDEGDEGDEKESFFLHLALLFLLPEISHFPTDAFVSVAL